MLVRLLRKREFKVVSLTIVLTICRPANCAGAISANSKFIKTNSTRLSLVTSCMRRMTDDVLLQNILSNLCSATQDTFAVKDQSEQILLFSPFANILIPFSLPGTLVSAIKVVPVCFRQHCANKVRFIVLSLCCCVALW